MNRQLPPLPYERDALEPYMSARTLDFHYNKHHRGYLEKLEELIRNTDMADLSVEEIMCKTGVSSEHPEIFNNAAQVWNHTFFWSSMRPGGGAPEGKMGAVIERDFGSYADFSEAFVKAAKQLFGSGWAWLVQEGSRCTIETTSDAMNPRVQGRHCLIACDVWEHAYYLDYQNQREKFVKNFLEHLVNWDLAAARLHAQPDLTPARAAGAEKKRAQASYSR